VALMVQAQSLRGYRELVRDLRGNPTRLLRQADIDPADLNRLTAFVDFEALTDLLERSAAQLRCPDFGLRLAERQDIGILGTLAIAMRHSATVSEAVQCVSKYLEVYNAAIAFTIKSAYPRGQARLEFRLLPGHRRWAQTAEHGIGLTWRILTLLSEGRCTLQGVWLPHHALATELEYRARFDAPLVFGADNAALAIAEKDLNLPISENIPELHDVATRYLDSQGSQRRRAPLTVQVRQAVEALLGTGTCSHAEVARVLCMHPRTLQRRLREEGTTFEAVKDEARQNLARQYLAQPDLPLTQITMLLGYSEQSALGRSCRRWFDLTPREVRARLLVGSHKKANT
jgi:AraC-like DNA-binding protein